MASRQSARPAAAHRHRRSARTAAAHPRPRAWRGPQRRRGSGRTKRCARRPRSCRCEAPACIRGHQSQPEPIRANHWPIISNHWPISCNQSQSLSIRSNQRQLEANQSQSDAIFGQSEANQRPIRGQSEANQRPIRGQSEANQRPISTHLPLRDTTSPWYMRGIGSSSSTETVGPTPSLQAAASACKCSPQRLPPLQAAASALTDDHTDDTASSLTPCLPSTNPNRERLRVRL